MAPTKRKATCQELLAQLEALGIKKLPADHPIYSEGPSISFVNRTPNINRTTKTPDPQEKP